MAAQPSDAVGLREKMVRKPRALRAGSAVLPIGLSSPGAPERVAAGLRTLEALGLRALEYPVREQQGFVVGTTEERRGDFLQGLAREDVDALVAIRGGYGSNYLLDGLTVPGSERAKLVLGYSDLTSLQVFLWQRYGWVTIYGPMIAAGLDHGDGAEKGFDKASLMSALFETNSGWNIPLRGEALVTGAAESRFLGGCMTLVETTLGTPWELDTRGAILLLEDRGMKPWQVDRALMHLLQAGKFQDVRGILLGDFPECEAPFAGSPTVRDVCARILAPLGVPVVYGAPVGHTMRAQLTVPLGVRARLHSEGESTLEILEPAVTA
ncbi:MAG TPA: LD-carboxypeptidase [Candidatus Dormibacteraeota bacterium]|nr:LD-carboxypeptidase [Candidatus Dormibacteraeota bacterium]